MTKKRWSWILIGGGAVLTGALLAQSQGCGDDDDNDAATVTGNISAVIEPVAMRSTERTWLASLDLADLFGPSAAVAQACEASDLFVCVDNGAQEPSCSEVSESTCLFTVSIDVDDVLSIRFVQDSDASGTITSDDASADLTNPIEQVCDNVVIRLTDVVVDFPDEEATADDVDYSRLCTDPTATPTTDDGATATPTTTAEPTSTPTPTATT
jgi:hypothetical protein